jgi:hypothetical protein
MTASKETIGGASRVHLSRRVLLKRVTLGGAAVLLAAAPRPAAAKMTESAAGYQDNPKGDASCTNCTLFVAPASCQIVDGAISPKGWCRFYAKKS